MLTIQKVKVAEEARAKVILKDQQTKVELKDLAREHQKTNEKATLEK